MKEMKILIPTIISKIHEELVQNFLLNELHQIDTKLKRVWIKSSNDNIIPV